MRAALICLLLPALAVAGAGCRSSGAASAEAASGGSGGEYEPGVGGGAGGAGGAGQAGSGGTGGDGGDGGSVGTGGSGGHALPAPDWILDPASWQDLPDGDLDIWNDDCRLKVARPERIQMPRLEWKTCGAACERADLVQGLGFKTTKPQMTTRRRAAGSQALLSIGHQAFDLGDDRKFLSWRYLDLATGETFGFASVVISPRVNGCLHLRMDRQPLGMRLNSPLYPGEVWAKGAVNPANGEWWWSTPWRPNSDEEQCIQILLEDHRRWVVACPRQLSVTPRESSALEPLEGLADTVVTAGDSDGGTAFWAEVGLDGAGSRIRRWSPGMDASELVADDLPGDICGLATGDGTLAAWSYLSPSGRSCHVFQPNGSFLWIGPNGERRSSPKEPEEGGITDITTWGSFVAAIIHPLEFDETYVLLMRIPDWSTRKIVPFAGHRSERITLSERYLYYAQTPLDAHLGEVREVRRYDLERFDSIGEPYIWPSPFPEP